MKFSTKAVHCGQKPDPCTGAMIPPIYMTSTFFQESPGETKGYDYTRAGNPNFTNLEEQLAPLENASYATVFSSGLGALTGMISTLSSGDRVVAVDGIYGGTYRLFTKVFNKFGIKFECVSLSSPDGLENLEKALKSNPKWLFFETPTNPVLEIFDIEALCSMAKQNGVLTVVDNTFASPYCQNPLKWGADIVWHSATKYLGGHSDVIGGAVMSNSPSLKQDLDFARMSIGLNPSPFDAWLISRGIKTLALRMEKHSSNALEVAKFLSKHPKTKKVHYPGLSDHPAHFIARKQMQPFSGIVAAEFNFSIDMTKKLISSFKWFALGESLGGIESLVSSPALMTHASIPPAERHRMGIGDSLVRFSVGIEDIEDLLADLQSTLEQVN